MTSDFDRFLDSVRHGGREWWDGFDLWALDRVVDEQERSQVETMMLDLLRAHGDTRAVGALAALGTPTALAAIREALSSPRAEMVASAAHALARVDPDAALRGARHALQSPDSSTRATAVQALRSLDGHAGEAALLAAIDDGADNVRILATEGIFDLYGLRPPQGRGRGLGLLWMRLTSNIRAIRRAALAELTPLLAQLKQGRTAEELGLAAEPDEPSPALERYLKSWRAEPDAAGTGLDLDLEALDALTGDERAWAELSLLDSLDRLDPRVPRALVHIRSQFAADALVERAHQLARAPSWPFVDPASHHSVAFHRNAVFIVEVARALAQLGKRREAEETLKLLAGCPYEDVRDRARTALA